MSILLQTMELLDMVGCGILQGMEALPVGTNMWKLILPPLSRLRELESIQSWNDKVEIPCWLASPLFVVG